MSAAQHHGIEGDFDRSALRNALKEVCAEAKLRGVRAEHVLIAVKEIWSALPEARALVCDSLDKRILSQLVTMTLDEYYPRNQVRS